MHSYFSALLFFFYIFEKGKSLSFFIFHAKQHILLAEWRDEYWMRNLLFFATFISDHWQCLKKVFFEFRKEKFQRITHNSQLSSVLKFIPHTCDICVWIYSKFFALSLRMRKTNQILMRLHYIAQFISRLRSLIHTLL